MGTGYYANAAIRVDVIEATGERCDQDEDFILLSVLRASTYFHNRLLKQPCHTSALPGRAWVRELLQGHPRRLYNMCRVNKYVFFKLCEELTTKYRLCLSPIGAITLEESVAMFLSGIALRMSNRQLQERFQHSGETISRHFHLVLDALKLLAYDYLQPHPEQTQVPRKIRENPKYRPFKDAIGALDGTHVACVPPTEESYAYYSRKGIFTQNILAVCDFEQRFTFMSCGWEGSMHDGRVFKAVVNNPVEKFPHPIGDKYYLVDAGYKNQRGYLAPYKGERMHLQQFRHGAEPRNATERFNQLHSALRSVIERAFGVWKARWAILHNMPPYDFDVQVALVGCTMALHNFIHKHRDSDQEIFDATMNASTANHSNSASGQSSTEHNDLDDLEVENPDDDFIAEDTEMNARRDLIRDQVACQYLNPI